MKKAFVCIFALLAMMFASVASAQSDNNPSNPKYVKSDGTFDFQKFHADNPGSVNGDNPPPPMDFTNSPYSLYQNYYAGVNYGSVNPSRDTGTGMYGMATRVNVSWTGNGSFYPHLGLILNLPNTYGVRPVSAGMRVLYATTNVSNYNDFDLRFVMGVRNDVGGADTNISSTMIQTLGPQQGIVWRVVQGTLSNPSGGAWKQWVVAAHSGLSFNNTRIAEWYMIGWVVMPNGDTIWTDPGNGNFSVPPLATGPFYPTLGAINVPINPVCFNWMNVAGIRYRLQVSTDQNFPAWAIVYDQIVDAPPTCVYGLVTGLTYYWRIATSYEPSGPFGGWVTLYFTAGNPVGITPINGEIPKMYALGQSYPNPFNPSTKIKFDVPKEGNVKISVYDITGKEMKNLVNQAVKPGTYEIDFNGSNLSTGVYFYTMISGDFVQTKKMMLIK
jgi:hypothetical protein